MPLLCQLFIACLLFGLPIREVYSWQPFKVE
jgi:hypothetical protein